MNWQVLHLELSSVRDADKMLSEYVGTNEKSKVKVAFGGAAAHDRAPCVHVACLGAAAAVVSERRGAVRGAGGLWEVGAEGRERGGEVIVGTIITAAG